MKSWRELNSGPLISGKEQQNSVVRKQNSQSDPQNDNEKNRIDKTNAEFSEIVMEVAFAIDLKSSVSSLVK